MGPSEETRFGPHQAWRVFSRGGAGKLPVLDRQVRQDLVWLCPNDGRLYHVSVSLPAGMDEPPELPEDFTVQCCQPAPVIGKTTPTARPRRAGKAVPRPSDDSVKASGPADKSPATSAAVNPEDLLHATPHPNRTMTIERQGKGGIVTTTRPRPRYLVPPITWFVKFRPLRRVGLDELGMQVLDLCDGRRTFEQVVEEFARVHRLTFREGQLSVTQFLAMLAQRGLIEIVGKGKDRPWVFAAKKR